MPHKVKNNNKKYNKNDYRKNDRNDNRKYSGQQHPAGKISVQNFPGTLQQFKQWIKSMFSGTYDTFDARDKQTYIEVTYYHEDMRDKLIGINNSIYSNSQVMFIDKEPVDGKKGSKDFKTPTQMVDEILQENFNKETNYVDLSNVVDKLVEKGYRKHVDLMFHSKIIQQLKNKYPNTEGIGYNNNNLTSLSIFKDLEKGLPQLVALNLMNNQIKDVQQLEFIKNIPLEVLSLNNNVVCNQKEFELFVYFL